MYNKLICGKRYTFLITEDTNIFKAVEGKCFKFVPYMEEPILNGYLPPGEHVLLLLNIEQDHCYFYYEKSNHTFACPVIFADEKIKTINTNKIWDILNG